MPLVFDSTVARLELKTRWINGLDFTNDGSLVSVAYIPQGEQAGVRIYRTIDNALVGEWGAGVIGRGVAFSGDGSHLYYLLQDYEGGLGFYQVGLDDNRPEKIATYHGSEALHDLKRDLGTHFIAVVGNAVEVWDTRAGEVIRFKEAASPLATVHACFNAKGTHLYVYGLTEATISVLDVQSDTVFGQWTAPAPFGEQLIVSPHEDYLVSVAKGDMGVFVYNLGSNERYRPDIYNENSFTRPFLFSYDNSLLITLAINLLGQPLPTGDMVTGPELTVGRPTAVASAWQAPIIAYGIKNNVFLVRLIEQ